MAYRFALAGNPNSGKTTLFNDLTGSNAHVGNWPGVTVERKESKCKRGKEQIQVIDLPGIYSLSPYTQEEVIARDYLSQEKPDLIINIVDATNIERNLYLTTQLLELEIPTIVALNMMDEVQKQGDKIDLSRLEESFGIPFVPIVAVKGEGVDQLLERAIALVKGQVFPQKNVLEDTPISATLEEVRTHLQSNGYPSTAYYAVKLLERDEKINETLKLDEALLTKVNQLITEQERQRDEEFESMIADLRYQYISAVIGKHVRKKRKAGEFTLSDRVDKVLTNRILGIPIFLLVMFAVFQVSLGPIAIFITDPFVVLVSETIPEAVLGLLEAGGASEVVTGLVIDGIFGGIGAVLGFLPLIVLLFMCLSILEDSGYMARVAFIMDRIFRRFGLSGKAFVPLLMAYGCAVPAIMATRTLEDEKSRRLAITLMPFMTCGARIPVYAVFVGAFFASHQGLVMFSIYVLGILVAMLSCLLLNKTVFKGEAAPFVMELPPYRFPTIVGILRHTWDKSKGYVIRVGTILLAMTVVIWFCQAFNFSLEMVEDASESIFGIIGGAIAPIFAANGFGLVGGEPGGLVHWQVGAALLTGFVAKEAVVSTLGILYINEEVEEITGALGIALVAYFTPLSAFALMVFVLLYAPCLAAIATARKELGSWKWTMFTVVYQCGIAWFLSMLVYQVGRLLGIGLA